MNLLKEELANVLSLGLSVPISSQLFEYPKQPIHGDLSIPCFTLAQELKMSPHTIALRIQTILSAVTSIDKVDVIGGYANVHFNRTTFADLLFSKKKKRRSHIKEPLRLICRHQTLPTILDGTPTIDRHR